MPDLSNHDLDDLFQQGSERYEFEFNPEAWRRMETLLERRRRRALLWWWFAGLGLIVLLLLVSYRYLSEKGKTGAEALPSGEQANHAPETDTSGAPGPLHKDKAGTLTDSLAFNPSIPIISDSSSPRVKGGRKVPGPPSPGLRRMESARVQISPGLNNGPAHQRKTIEDQRVSGEDQTITIEEDGVDSKSIAELNALKEQEPPTLLFRIAVLELPELQQDIHVRQQDLPLLEETSKGNGFMLSINGAPQISSVGPGDPGPTNLRLGLGVEYRFGHNWGLGAGVYRVKKRYTAGEGEYVPPKGFWVRQIAPDYSVGWCDVLELPLYGAYYLSGHQSDGFFLEAGITSLYMREEWYYYHYRQNDPDLIHYWEGRNAHHAWLSLLQLSPGYQIVPGRSWRIQIAPYIQIPLGGVGHGKLSLYSLGLNARVGIFKDTSKN